MMIYGVESKAALQRYFDGPRPPSSRSSASKFEHHLRMERVFGAVDASVTAAALPG